MASACPGDAISMRLLVSLMQEAYARMEKTRKLVLLPQLLQLEKLAISMPLPDSPASGCIAAYSGFSTATSAASSRASRLKSMTSGPRVSCHLDKN